VSCRHEIGLGKLSRSLFWGFFQWCLLCGFWLQRERERQGDIERACEESGTAAEIVSNSIICVKVYTSVVPAASSTTTTTTYQDEEFKHCHDFAAHFTPNVSVPSSLVM
jgi:hypothetical protein